MVWACPPPPPPPALPACAVQAAHRLVRQFHHPHLKWVHAVETTYDQAAAAIGGNPPAAPGGPEVVFIEIKGKLVDDFDPTPPFVRRPYKGRFYHLVLDRATCGERIRGISTKGVKLRPLGNVTTVE
jgi:hypothetical protein